jgi:hypothetical protein
LTVCFSQMALPKDVVRVVKDFAENYQQNVVLYDRGEGKLTLFAHVYRTNGVIEAKRRMMGWVDGEGGKILGEPFEPTGAVALGAFIRPEWDLSEYEWTEFWTVTYRGKTPPPISMVVDHTNELRVIREHFGSTIQTVETSQNYNEGDADLCTPAQFARYAWDILD